MTAVTEPRTHPVLRRSGLLIAASALVLLDGHLISPYVAGAVSALRHPKLYWVAVAFAAEILSMLALARLQRRMLLATGTRVPMPTFVGLTYAAYAMSGSLPAGSAVSTGYTFRRLRKLGATATTAGFTVISSGVLSSAAYALLVVAGFACAGGSSNGPLALVVGLSAGGLLLVLVRWLIGRPDLVERVGLSVLHGVNRVLRRAPDSGVSELRSSTRMARSIRPRRRDWAAGMAAATINWVADLGCLLACCGAVSAHGATVRVVLLAYLGGTSISTLSVLPGGLGVVDAAFIVILVRHGVGATPATAAILLYRVLSFGFGLLAGWSAWIAIAQSWRGTGGERAARTRGSG